jgi:hypothetical protein
MPVFLSFFSNGKVTFPTGHFTSVVMGFGCRGSHGRVQVPSLPSTVDIQYPYFAMYISHLSDVHCIDYAQQACTYERSYVIIFLDIFIIFFPGSEG